MSDYVFAYHGGKEFDSPEEGQKHMKKWRAWLQGLGDAVITSGTPLGLSSLVSSEGIMDFEGPDHLSGFSIFRADGMCEALEIAKSCPHLDIGTIEVAEVMEIK